ncbi:MAG: DUF5789 family protein [Halobacteriota archaeon]
MRLHSTGQLIDAHNYPTTTGELVDAYGDQVLELQNGSETLAEVLERLGPQEFENAEDVRDAVFTAVGAGAIGRRYYSDRDPTTFGEYGPTPLSF